MEKHPVTSFLNKIKIQSKKWLGIKAISSEQSFNIQSSKKYMKQSGFNLLEALLVIAVISISIVGLYQYYQSVQAQEASHEASQNTAELTSRIARAYDSMASFSTISVQNIIDKGLVPPNIEITDNEIISPFGNGEILILSETLDGVAGRGFSITYTNVPQKLCSSFISTVNSAKRYRDVLVAAGPNQTFHSVAQNGKLNQASVATHCSSSEFPSIRFVYQKPSEGTEANEDLTLCSPPPDETVTTECPTGYTGEIIKKRTASCPSHYGPAEWGPFQEVSNTCALICTPDPSSPQQQINSCPTGYVGAITMQRESICSGYTGAPTWTAYHEVSNTCQAICVPPSPQFQTASCEPGYIGEKVLRKTYSCPTETGSPVPGPWEVYSSTCSAECTLPSPDTQTQWIPDSEACGEGYTGQKTWEYEVRSTAYCPQLTGSYEWGTPVATGNTRNMNTTACQVICNEDSETRWITTTQDCPAGTGGGNITWELEQTRNYLCPQSEWDSWQPTGNTRNYINTCQEACVAPPSTTESQSRSASCLNGRLTPSGGTSFTQTRTRSITYSCSEPYGNYTTTQGTWSSYSPTESVACSSACYLPTPSTETETENRTVSRNINGCDAGSYGYYTEQKNQQRSRTREAYCPAPTGSHSWGSWTTFSSWEDTSAWSVSSVNCISCPTYTYEYKWVAKSATCPYGAPGSHTWEAEQKRTLSYSCPAGTATLPSPNAGPWSDTGNIRNEVNTCQSPCPAAPSDDTRQFAGCPFGQYGSWTQRNPYESAIPPMCWHQSVNTWTPTTPPAGACQNCPPPSTETRWISASAPCPSGQTGSHTWEKDQKRSVSYSCPYGTATLPDPNYGGWVDNGNIRNEVNTCQVQCGPAPSPDNRQFAGCASGQYGSWLQSNPYESASSPVCWTQSINTWTPATPPAGACQNCPANTTDSENRWAGTTFGINNCSAGQYGYNNYEHWQVRTRTKSYSCPAGTASLPTPNYSGWSGWSNTGTYRYTGSSCVNCPANTTETDPGPTEYRAMNACPAGKYGYHYQYRNTWRWRSVGYNCPAGTASLPAPSYGNWNDAATEWITSSNDCVNCPANTTDSENRWAGTTFGINNCSAGQYGHNNYEYWQVRTRTISYSCPAGTTSLPAPTYGSWSGWSNTGTYRYTGSSCQNCPANTTETDPKPTQYRAMAYCPAGQYGYHYQYRNVWNWRTVSYNCPAGTASLPTPNYGTWTEAATDWTTSSNDCVNCPPNVAEYSWETYNAGCPPMHTGSRTYERERYRVRSYSCPAGSTSLPAPTYSGYTYTGNIRNEVNTCKAACVVSASTTKIWGSMNCQGTMTAGTIYHGQTKSVLDPTFGPTKGTGVFTCNNGVLEYTAALSTCEPGDGFGGGGPGGG